MLNIKEIRAQFPILNRKVNGNDLIYFDNGATTQKPQVVIDEIANYYKNENANVHRGVHFLSGLATDKFEQTRNTIKEFIGAKHNYEIIFTKGATDSINLVANGYRSLLKKGDEIIISELEHHSNIVPWQICSEISGASLKVIPLTDEGELNMNEFDNLLNSKTKLIAVSHISNTLGTINPIKYIIEKAHKMGAKVLIDGAQAASHIPLNMETLGADFYVFSAHKLYGPTGVGVLYGKEDALNKLPVYQGGGEMIKDVRFTGTTYADLPHKFEAGTPNIAGVIAFKTAIDFISQLGLKNIVAHEDTLLQYATSELLKIEGVKIYGTAKQKTGIISFNIDGIHPYDIGVIVDKLGVAIRTGHHCTQPIMERYNIPGTARISFAIYNTKEEINICIAAIKQAKKMLS
ncbi:MAG: cysteine sulfinate desulfinase [Cryomorphaceae bacterium BACL11 MAG-121128-bin16]|nr:MAG: cysteine sulfinate desulfinase [Cryomorphaceae bacterium BACL11 MAG-121128-bin16]MBC8474315.1 cysteine desulfurase [Cryomorphaceae bacterium]